MAGPRLLASAMALSVLAGWSDCALIPCPLDDAIAKSRWVISLETEDPDAPCYPEWSGITAAPGELALSGCEEMAEPDAVGECGYELHARCPGHVIDGVGTRAIPEIRGTLEWNLGEGTTGTATIDWRAASGGWLICSSSYRVEAWPLLGER